MNLDDLARRATTELVEQSPTDLASRLGDLKTTRRHRAVTKTVAALTAAVLLGGGAWWVADGRDAGPQPADPGPNDTVGNGALVYVSGRDVASVSGELAVYPQDVGATGSVAFTADGSELVYANRARDIVAFDVTTGDTRTLGTCASQACDFSLSPDGLTLAFGARADGEPGLELRATDSDRVTFLPTPGVGDVRFPRWSPDGTRLAFGTMSGFYMIDADGRGFHEVFRQFPRTSPLPVTWSPDGRRLALFAQMGRAARDGTLSGPRRFMAVTVDWLGGDVESLHRAGACYCLGIGPPGLVWSPDGSRIALSTIDSGPPGDPGAATMGSLLLLSPEGEVLETWGGGHSQMAWQPLPPGNDD